MAADYTSEIPRDIYDDKMIQECTAASMDPLKLYCATLVATFADTASHEVMSLSKLSAPSSQLFPTISKKGTIKLGTQIIENAVDQAQWKNQLLRGARSTALLAELLVTQTALIKVRVQYLDDELDNAVDRHMELMRRKVARKLSTMQQELSTETELERKQTQIGERNKSQSYYQSRGATTNQNPDESDNEDQLKHTFKAKSKEDLADLDATVDYGRGNDEPPTPIMLPRKSTRAATTSSAPSTDPAHTRTDPQIERETRKFDDLMRDKLDQLRERQGEMLRYATGMIASITDRRKAIVQDLVLETISKDSPHFASVEDAFDVAPSVHGLLRYTPEVPDEEEMKKAQRHYENVDYRNHHDINEFVKDLKNRRKQFHLKGGSDTDGEAINIMKESLPHGAGVAPGEVPFDEPIRNYKDQVRRGQQSTLDGFIRTCLKNETANWNMMERAGITRKTARTKKPQRPTMSGGEANLATGTPRLPAVPRLPCPHCKIASKAHHADRADECFRHPTKGKDNLAAKHTRMRQRVMEGKSADAKEQLKAFEQKFVLRTRESPTKKLNPEDQNKIDDTIAKQLSKQAQAHVAHHTGDVDEMEELRAQLKALQIQIDNNNRDNSANGMEWDFSTFDKKPSGNSATDGGDEDFQKWLDSPDSHDERWLPRLSQGHIHHGDELKHDNWPSDTETADDCENTQRREEDTGANERHGAQRNVARSSVIAEDVRNAACDVEFSAQQQDSRAVNYEREWEEDTGTREERHGAQRNVARSSVMAEDVRNAARDVEFNTQKQDSHLVNKAERDPLTAFLIPRKREPRKGKVKFIGPGQKVTATPHPSEVVNTAVDDDKDSDDFEIVPLERRHGQQAFKGVIYTGSNPIPPQTLTLLYRGEATSPTEYRKNIAQGRTYNKMVQFNDGTMTDGAYAPVGGEAATEVMVAGPNQTANVRLVQR